MKTIFAALAAVALFAANASASDDFATTFFEQQALNGGNTVNADLIETGQIVHPLGVFGASAK